MGLCECLDLSISLRVIHFLTWPASLQITIKNQTERSFFQAILDLCCKFLHNQNDKLF
jgi:hypothetical protein